jgi:hypothetical protein
VGWYYVDADSTGYQGHGWLQVTHNHMSTLDIIMQEKGAYPSWSDAAPVISSITVTPADPYYGQIIRLSVVASDPDNSCVPGPWTTCPPPPDGLTYRWSSKCKGVDTAGTFSAATSMSTDFTSSCHGTEVIEVTVTDSKGIFSGATLGVPYTAEGGTVNLLVNHYPSIDDLVGTDAQVHPGQTIGLELSASDIDGDPLTASWSATCGSFDDATSFAPVWTAPATTGDCTLSVSVHDDHGPYSKAQGSLVLHVRDEFLSLAPFAEECDKTTWVCVAASSGATASLVPGGLSLSKDADTTVAYSAGADILGVAGVPFTSASFDTTGAFAPGSPRLTLLYSGGSCTLDTMPAPVGNTYTLTYPAASPYSYQVCPHIIDDEPLIGAYLVIDGMGAAQTITLTNIKVNGVAVQ